jgi:cell division transport system ATP-binding protein
MSTSAIPSPTALPAAPAAAAPLVELDHVSRRHGTFRLALSDLSLRVARGELVVLQGGNGAGKTTLLRLIAALDAPTEGRVHVAGQDLARLRPRAVALLRQSIGFVPQDLWLLDDRSVLENVMLPALAAGLARHEAVTRAQAALERVGLDPTEAARHGPARLGGGDRQRAALARALVNRPVLLLADEPTAHLDNPQAAAVTVLLGQFAAAGVTVLVASRDTRDLWPSAARRLLLRDGRLATAAEAVA